MQVRSLQGEIYNVAEECDEFAGLWTNMGENIWETDGLLSQFESYARGRAEQIREEYSYGTQSNDAENWELEANTWSLVYRLLGARLFDADLDESKVTHPYASDLFLVSKRFNQNIFVKEAEIVREWLEATAPEYYPAEIQAGYMEFTVRQMERGANIHRSLKGEEIITSLDPDAPTRQSRKIAEEDQNYERALNQTIFDYIRRGNLDGALDLCEKSKQPWKAASLRGRFLFSDGEMDNNDENGTVGGNVNRELWRFTCYQMAREESFDPYERAVYALFAGDLENAKVACKSWEDHLWANYFVMMDADFGRDLQAKPVYFHSDDVVPATLPTSARTPDQILDSLFMSENKDLADAASSPFRIMQARIILGQMEEILRGLKTQIDMANAGIQVPSIGNFPQILRFLTHLVLVLRKSGYLLNSEYADFIIRSYVDFLIAAKKGTIIALYAAALPAHMQVDSYARFLTLMDDEMLVRWEYLKLAGTHGVDVHMVARRTVQLAISSLRDEGPLPNARDVVFTKLNDLVTSEEEQLIRVLEWLIYEPSQSLDALICSNTLVRRFLVRGRYHAAIAVLKKIPNNLISPEWKAMTLKDFKVDNETDPRSRSIATSVREHATYRSLLECLGAYNLWISLYAKSTTMSKYVARSNVSAKERQDWTSKLIDSTTRVESALREMAQSGWNVDAEEISTEFGTENEPEDVTRNQEVGMLRLIYLSEMLFWLHQILFSTRDIIRGNLEKSIRLADFVAVDNTDLLDVLDKSGRLPDFLNLMRVSGVECLRQPAAGGFPWISNPPTLPKPKPAVFPL
ncbi:nuclear pore protein 84/107 [Cladochytrium replicatum]|nr:nuclear pore protein 84/107 [Cladochytrium replicatum]